jgi:hypothetical protein
MKASPEAGPRLPESSALIVPSPVNIYRDGHVNEPASLATRAAEYLSATLERHGNTLSDDHRRAVSAIPEMAELILKGHLQGRFRFGLPCGAGKTTAVRAVLRAIHLLGLPYRVAVACSKVEELCALKRTLQRDDGLPEESIGLMHSYVHSPAAANIGRDGFASEPSEGHDRQFLLVTHASVHSERLRPWMRDRALVFFDESLIVGEAQTLNLMSDAAPCVVGEWGDLKARAEFFPELAACVAWFDALVNRLKAEVTKPDGSEIKTVQLEPPDNSLTASFKRLKLFALDRLPNLARLLELTERAEELRVFVASGANRSLITYRTSVPDELQNVIVLDASDPIRELVHHDRRMTRAEDVMDSLADYRTREGGLASIKRHARVQFHVANDSGGRDTMRKAFSENDGAAMPWAIEKLVRLVKSKPEDSFLIFTYRDRDKVQFATTILKSLEKAGIDCSSMDERGNFRINIQTWGKETATNAYSHCQNVVLLGVLFQPQDSVAGRYLGQVDDVRSPLLASELRRLVFSECAHSIYQAINRACMRQVDAIEGVAQAKACNVYLWHRDSDIQRRLTPVLQGTPEWIPWREVGEEMNSQDVSRHIAAHLNMLEKSGERSISLRKLKAEVAPAALHTCWQMARDSALKVCSSWTIDGRSLVRLFPEAP